MLLCSPSFFFNDTATTEIYTLSLHDALPISRGVRRNRGGGHDIRRAPRGLGAAAATYGRGADLQTAACRAANDDRRLQSSRRRAAPGDDGLARPPRADLGAVRPGAPARRSRPCDRRWRTSRGPRDRSALSAGRARAPRGERGGAWREPQGARPARGAGRQGAGGAAVALARTRRR